MSRDRLPSKPTKDNHQHGCVSKSCFPFQANPKRVPLKSGKGGGGKKRPPVLKKTKINKYKRAMGTLQIKKDKPPILNQTNANRNFGPLKAGSRQQAGACMDRSTTARPEKRAKTWFQPRFGPPKCAGREARKGEPPNKRFSI